LCVHRLKFLSVAVLWRRNSINFLGFCLLYERIVSQKVFSVHISFLFEAHTIYVEVITPGGDESDESCDEPDEYGTTPEPPLMKGMNDDV